MRYIKKIDVTLNPNDMGSSITLSNNNLSLTSTNVYSGVRATHGKTHGKWYWEVKLDSGNVGSYLGLSQKDFSITASNNLTLENWRAYYAATGNKFPENVSYGAAWIVGDVIGFALNLDDGTLEIFKNGTSMGLSHTNLEGFGEVYPTFKSGTTTSKTISFNFGATPFLYPTPSGFYSYNLDYDYKFLISSGDELYSIAPKVISKETVIPKMTSDTTPSGRVIYSKFSTNPAWQAFDKINSTYTSLSTHSEYLGYEFSSPIIIGEYNVGISAIDSSTIQSSPKDWTFEGSNDGVNWVVLDTQVGQTWSAAIAEKKYEISIEMVSSYRSYRLNISNNNRGLGFTFIRSLEMFEYTPPKLLNVHDHTEESFIAHGMNKGISIDTYFHMAHKIYNVQDSSQIGSGKVFKKKIDTSKIPIKNVSI